MDTVCVIGSGVSGLTAIKHLREYGLNVVCYEKGSHVGGLWRYNTGDREGFGSVMRNTMLNTSKEFVTFSDFPMKSDLPNFIRNQKIHEYFEEYCEHFQLRQHIEFNTEVVEINRSADYEKTGNWDIRVKSNGVTSHRTFSAVMVCNGHHVTPSSPKIEGMENFRGTFVHSHNYKDHTPYTDRRVLVVGFGNSGGDAACELARVAKQVFVSTRNGSWVTRRVVQDGYPRDVILRSRHFEKMQSLLPKWLRSHLALRDYTSFFDHSLYGLRPKENPGQSPVLLADDLPLLLSGGFIDIRGGIKKFTENGVVFEDGTFEEIDDVIMCTGYDFDFSFIENGDVIPTTDNQVHLWKRMFPPGERHNTLAVIGLVDPLGPTITMAEMQSRAVAHIWATGTKLPSKEDMIAEIDAEKRATAARFICSARKASLQIDFISYMDALAQIIGCRPDLSLGRFLTDYQLAFLLLCGPVTATHYRLEGTHRWESARKHILGTFERVHLAMNPRSKEPPSTPYQILFMNTPTMILMSACAMAIMLLVCLIL